MQTNTDTDTDIYVVLASHNQDQHTETQSRSERSERQTTCIHNRNRHRIPAKCSHSFRIVRVLRLIGINYKHMKHLLYKYYTKCMRSQFLVVVVVCHSVVVDVVKELYRVRARAHLFCRHSPDNNNTQIVHTVYMCVMCMCAGRVCTSDN